MRTRAVRPAVMILAWVFLLGSLSPLVMDLGWPPHRMSAHQENTYVLRAVVDGKSYTSWGLTYEGEAGHRLRLAEIAGVLVALVLSVLPQDGPRRVGLVALAAWAGLWLGNAVRMSIIAPIHVFFLAALVMLVFFAATVARAKLGWRQGRRKHHGLQTSAPNT